MDRTISRSTRAILTALVVPLAVVSTALAVDVTGTVRVPSGFAHTPPESPEQARRARYWEAWNGFLAPRTLGFDPSRDLAVVLTGEGPMTEAAPAAPGAPEPRGFEIRNGGLWPSTLVERTGATLRILNTDPCSHQLTAAGHTALGPTPTAPGLTRQAVVAEAGSWPITDQVYAHVHGHLHVIDDLIARAVVQSDGAYRFSNVAPGTYTLKVFHGERTIQTREGVVVPEGRELTIEPIQLGAAQ